MILYSSVPIHFHIICDDTAQVYLEKRLALVKRPKNNIHVRFYRLTLDEMVARIHREGAINTDHSAGIRTSLLHPLCSTSDVSTSWADEALHPRDTT